MIDKVDIENTDDGAVITVHLKEKPKKLITNVTVNPGNFNDVQAVIQDWGHIRVPKTTLVFDTTIYRYFTMPKESAAIRNSGAGIRYEQLTYLYSTVKENAVVQNSGRSMRYEFIDTVRYQRHKESVIIRQTGKSMNYEQVEPSPI